MNPKSLDKGMQSDELDALCRRLRTALSLYESGVAMKRAQLRRQDGAASEQDIADRLAIWLRTRPGAELGDAEGIPGPAVVSPDATV